MKIQTKEELQQALIKLRESRAEKQKRNYASSDMAMCYSMSMSRYCTGHFIGKHKCISCGKDFGTDINDEIRLCQEERYQEYLQSQYLFFHRHPCFEEFYEKYNKNNGKVLDFLREQKLKFENNNKYSNDRNYYSEDEEKEQIKSFNRPLTKDEWIKLNTNCQQKDCFSPDRRYKTYEHLCQSYKDSGYDVKLEYNCPECCEKGKNEIEFWFRLNDNSEYVISYPYISGSRGLRYSTYYEYIMLFDFLCGYHTYNDILDEIYDSYRYTDEGIDLNIKKHKIDNALSKIGGVNIVYNKKEIIELIKQEYEILEFPTEDFYDGVFGFKNSYIDIKEKNETPEFIIKALNKILEWFDDLYEFSLSEYLILRANILKIDTFKMRLLSQSTMMEIVEKRTIYHLKKVDDFISNKSVYEYLETFFPKGEPIMEIFSDSMVINSKMNNEINNIVFKVLKMIVNIYGKNFKISVGLFEKLLKCFDELKDKFKLEDAQSLKGLMLTKKYVKNLVEGE